MSRQIGVAVLVATLMAVALGPQPALGDVNAAAPYQPSADLKGSLRILGSELKGAVELLAERFVEFHPEVRVATSHIPSSEGGIAGLYLGVSDLAPMGDDAKITDLMPFYNTFGYLPTEISVATGGYEKRGSLFAWAIVVNADNPLESISVEEIKRVFGGQRTGGWEIIDNNYRFTAKHALTSAELIRYWGQLGLEGEHADREIETFGYASPGFATSIQRHLLHWSKKWNPNFREFVESKQTAPGPDGYAVSSERPLEELESNPYAMGIAAIMHVKNYRNVKVLPVSWTDRSEATVLTPENVGNRSYPLIRDAYFYANKPPGGSLPPIVRAFLKFCLSSEGQQIIAQAGYYYPLPKAYLEAQLQKLD
ncbi:MAG: hypothetical protein OXG59_05455 [Gammaproteobacteria bacterium]|nr:hypothetical protein [Gammaproteobacteria bacterium]